MFRSRERFIFVVRLVPEVCARDSIFREQLSGGGKSVSLQLNTNQSCSDRIDNVHVCLLG